MMRCLEVDRSIACSICEAIITQHPLGCIIYTPSACRTWRLLADYTWLYILAWPLNGEEGVETICSMVENHDLEGVEGAIGVSTSCDVE